MPTKIALFLAILCYSIIVSQSFMYIIALKNVQTNMDAVAYIGLRKKLDVNFRANFKWVVYAALACSLLLVLLAARQPANLFFVCILIAFLALIVDTVIAIKGNLPINEMINNWSPDQFPSNWGDYRAKWLQVFQYRQIANITGFVSLLIGSIFGKVG